MVTSLQVTHTQHSICKPDLMFVCIKSNIRHNQIYGYARIILHSEREGVEGCVAYIHYKG